MAVSASTLSELAKSLLATAHDLEESIATALRGTDLGVPHFLILSHLDQHGAATTSELGRVSMVPPATLTRVLDKLVDLALVHRAVDDADRRRIIIRIADRGRTLVREWSSVIDERIAESFPALREWEAQAITDLLRSPRPN